MRAMTLHRPSSLCFAVLALGLTSCQADSGEAALSEIALPTFSKDRVAREAPAEARRLLSGGPSFDFMVISPSPDGQRVTDVYWETGDLSIIDLETGEETPVTDKGPWNESSEFAGQSVFSPDGSRIAYAWFAHRASDNPSWGYDVRSIGVDGTDMRIHMAGSWKRPTVVEDWSDDGRYLLVTCFPEAGGAQIATIDLTTDEFRVLRTTDPQGPRGSFFSPDGRFVAFDLRAAKDSRARDIFIMDIDDGAETPLIVTPDKEQLLGWLPDGSGILFHRIADDSRAIWKLPLREGRALGPPELVKDDVWQMTGFGFADDSYVYGVTVSNKQVHTARIDIDGSRVLGGLEPVSEVSGPETGGAGWLPDGKRYAYMELDAGETYVVVRSINGETLQEFSVPLDVGRSPRPLRWSEVGLLVFGEDGEGREGIHEISLETEEMSLVSETSLHTGFAALPPNVSEDGTRIRYLKRGALVEQDLRTGVEHELVAVRRAPISFSGGRSGSRPTRISPDGSMIAYAAFGPQGPFTNAVADGWAIEVESWTDGEVRSSAAELSWVHWWSVIWSPDNRYVFFSGVREVGDPARLMRFSLEDGSIEDVEGVPSFDWAESTWFSFSPDGQYIAIDAGENRSEIWRMTFDTEG